MTQKGRGVRGGKAWAQAQSSGFTEFSDRVESQEKPRWSESTGQNIGEERAADRIVCSNSPRSIQLNIREPMHVMKL